MKIIRRYMMFLISLLALIIVYFINAEIATKAAGTIVNSSKEMMYILPPVFVLLGLLDVWVPRDTMVKFMGEDSGFLGGILAFVLGSAAAGPLYVVFPIAAAFMKKGAKFTNILILIGAWSTTKIPMLLFEFSSLGARFTLTRLALNVPIIFFMTFVINMAFNKEEKAAVIERASAQA